MRQVSPARIWTTAAATFMHAWAVLALFELRPALGVLLHSISQGNGFWPATISLLQQFPDGVDLLVICTVVLADIWIFAEGSASSHEPKAEIEGSVGQTNKGPDRRYIRIGTAGGLFVLLVAISFNLAGPGRIVLTTSALAVAALLAMFLLLLRADSSARIVVKLQDIQRHLDSSGEHLREIDKYRRPDAPVT